MDDFVSSLLGGALIGVSASFLLVTLGRVAGVSGIVGNLLSAFGKGNQWRAGFVLGMVAMGALLLPSGVQARALQLESHWVLVLAGLLVGFGTRLGNGCTSGHGVCGISRLSIRSIVATGIFVGTAMLVVFVTRYWFGVVT